MSVHVELSSVCGSSTAVLQTFRCTSALVRHGSDAY